MSAGNKKLMKVRAKHSYQRQNEDELSFKKGDIITVRRATDAHVDFDLEVLGKNHYI